MSECASTLLAAQVRELTPCSEGFVAVRGFVLHMSTWQMLLAMVMHTHGPTPDLGIMN